MFFVQTNLTKTVFEQKVQYKIRVQKKKYSKYIKKTQSEGIFEWVLRINKFKPIDQFADNISIGVIKLNESLDFQSTQKKLWRLKESKPNHLMSYMYDICSANKNRQKNSNNYFEPFRISQNGDIITLQLNLIKNELCYFLNGINKGRAFELPSNNDNEKYHYKLCVSVWCDQTQIELL